MLAWNTACQSLGEGGSQSGDSHLRLVVVLLTGDIVETVGRLFQKEDSDDAEGEGRVSSRLRHACLASSTAHRAGRA